MNRDSEFFKRSARIAEQFLQTAVVIDDRAFRSEQQLEKVGLATAPATPSTAEPVFEDPSSTNKSEESAEDVTQNLEPHRFDPQPVIDGFARHGIVCGILNRVESDTLEHAGGRLKKLIDVADILIVDWHIHVGIVESTEETLRLVESILQQNALETPRQLRLIAIYTGENNLLSVAEAIRERIEKTVGSVAMDGNFCFTKGAVRIVVLGKKTNKRSQEAQAQEVDFAELGARAIQEFTSMTAGLVSNVALQSLASLRQTTHRILDRFSPVLDPAYLVHRSLLETPAEADEHLCLLIAAELQAVLEGAKLVISEAALAEWIEERQQRTNTFTDSGFGNSGEEKDFLLRMFRNGHSELIKSPIPEQIGWLKDISPFHGTPAMNRLIEFINGGPSVGSNEELAMVMAVRTNYSADPPQLTLGTIVLHEQGNAKTYWLCLQPRCDCIRINKNYLSFPMLQLSQQADATKSFGLLLKLDKKYVRLRIDTRPSKLRGVTFKANKEKEAVVATQDPQGRYWFDTKDSQFRCRWVAELKFEQAQRAVNQFASQNSRVGLTESEWQRRWNGDSRKSTDP